MSIVNFVASLGLDLKNIMLSVGGAVFGALLKWGLDINLIERMGEENKALLVNVSDANKQLAQRETELNQRAIEIAQLHQRLEERGIIVENKENEISRLIEDLRDSEASLWTKFPSNPKFLDHNVRIGRQRPIILTIANLKGGVGKTTLTGNLVAYFDKLGKRVLAIDLDYQGSLTTMLRNYGGPR